MNNNYLEQIKQAFSDMPTWFVCIFTGIVLLSAIFAWLTGYALNRENLIDRVRNPVRRRQFQRLYRSHRSLNPWLWLMLVLCFPVFGTVVLAVAFGLAPSLHRRLERQPVLLTRGADIEFPCRAWIFWVPVLTGWGIGALVQPLLSKYRLDTAVPAIMEIRAPVLQIAAGFWFLITFLRLLRILLNPLYLIPHRSGSETERAEYLGNFVEVSAQEIADSRFSYAPLAVLHCYHAAQTTDRYLQMLRWFAVQQAKGARSDAVGRRSGYCVLQWNGDEYTLQLFRREYLSESTVAQRSGTKPARIRIVEACDAQYRGGGVTEIAVLIWNAAAADRTAVVTEQDSALSGSVFRVVLPLRYWIAETLTSLLGVIVFCTPVGIRSFANIVSLFRRLF